MRTLGLESSAERRLKEIQESCLDSAFHMSMDRVTYSASDRSEPEAEQKEALQEVKDLENPEASATLLFLTLLEPSGLRPPTTPVPLLSHPCWIAEVSQGGSPCCLEWVGACCGTAKSHMSPPG